ncbi:hypothetical protein FRX31_014271 [Thalictrum thalictroides]|uniref:Uncharacterized protein n=1 Tax=Thalictrum thalictroides TaxID=46969 RepID=A0A7J6WJ48_THATH|nr:hypothetical protein FRX31_014271 [Thalictrum thalictroides]
MEETRIVKQILNMQFKQNKEKMAVAFTELSYIDVQDFEVTGLIPIELCEADTSENSNSKGAPRKDKVSRNYSVRNGIPISNRF